ncbi:MAG: LysM peptidoglycan-binding domain-containing protein [Anaerolineales bacterium]
MKKSVQALINRRRARMIQSLLAALAGVILLAICWLLFTVASGPVTALLRTATPPATLTLTPTITFTPAPPTPTKQFTDTPIPTEGPSPTPTPVIYTVVDGDTFFSISTQFGVAIDSIKLASGLTGDILVIGQVLTIPVGGGFEPPTTTPIPTGLARGTRIEYTVLLGDSLEIIASKFNSTVEDIAQQNRRNNRALTNADLRARDVLIVRVNLVTPTPTLAASVTPAVTLTPTP